MASPSNRRPTGHEVRYKQTLKSSTSVKTVAIARLNTQRVPTVYCCGLSDMLMLDTARHHGQSGLDGMPLFLLVILNAARLASTCRGDHGC